MLKEIEIENFKSFKHLDFKCRNLNLLTGLNGSGKSSLIQTLRFINEFESVFARSGSQRIGGYVDLFSDTFKVGTYRDLLYCYAGKKKSQRVAHIKACATESDEPVELRIEPVPSPAIGLRDYMDQPQAFVRYEAAVRAYSRRPSHRDAENKFDPENLYVREELIAALAPVCITNYLSADSVAPEAIHELDASISLGNSANGRRAASYLANLLGLGVESWCCHPNCKSDFLINQVNAWLDEISPGAYVYPRKIPELSRVVLSYGYDHGRGAPQFRPINVGFGLSYILPMLVLLLTASEGNMLVIENPEAHLHPRGQAEVGKLLARAAAAGIQLFVETHSDHVINGVRVAVKEGLLSPEDVQIAFFERKRHADITKSKAQTSDVPRTEIYSTMQEILIDRSGSLSVYPDGFMDEWNNQLLELLK